jgi:hypothetical protein
MIDHEMNMRPVDHTFLLTVPYALVSNIQHLLLYLFQIPQYFILHAEFRTTSFSKPGLLE